jgi:hypothetical protein
VFSWSTCIIRVRRILLVWLIVHILVSQSLVVLIGRCGFEVSLVIFEVYVVQR